MSITSKIKRAAKSKKGHKPDLIFEQLEERIVFDASWDAAASVDGLHSIDLDHLTGTIIADLEGQSIATAQNGSLLPEDLSLVIATDTAFDASAESIAVIDPDPTMSLELATADITDMVAGWDRIVETAESDIPVLSLTVLADESIMAVDAADVSFMPMPPMDLATEPVPMIHDPFADIDRPDVSEDFLRDDFSTVSVLAADQDAPGLGLWQPDYVTGPDISALGQVDMGRIVALDGGPATEALIGTDTAESQGLFFYAGDRLAEADGFVYAAGYGEMLDDVVTVHVG